MISMPEALLLLTAGICIAIAVYALLLRPAWAHLDFDRQLWIFGYTETRAWFVTHWKAEGVLVVSGFLVGFLSKADTIVDRLVNAFSTSFGTIAVGVILLLLWECARAPAALVAAAKLAPYNADVSFAALKQDDTVLLRVRNNLETGPFSAQNTLIDGLVRWDDRTFSVAWQNTVDTTQRIPIGEEQHLKLLRVDLGPASERGRHRASKIFVFEAGVAEREIVPRVLKIHGDCVQAYVPITLRLKIRDPREIARRVMVFVNILVTDTKAEIETHLIRDY